MKQLSIIIVTYNSSKLIFDCLGSIFKFNDIGEELEVIVVDNCSLDVEYVFSQIKLQYGNKVVLIKSTLNGGYGHGNNQGIKVASSSRLIVMNPDVRIVNPIFIKIIHKMNSNKNIGLMGVKFVDGSNALYYKPEYATLFRLIFSKQFLKLGLYNIKHVFFSGSFLIFDKSSFEGVGLFDENFFMYYEEADVSNRLLAIGKEVVLAEDLAVLHLAHGRKVNYNLLRIESKSRQYYCKKYPFNIDKYYSMLLLIYRAKYIIASVIFNKLKSEEFKVWIKLCRNRGEI